jgi:hypothetical protein
VLSESREGVGGIRQALTANDLDLLGIGQAGDEGGGLLVGFLSYAEVDCERGVAD